MPLASLNGDAAKRGTRPASASGEDEFSSLAEALKSLSSLRPAVATAAQVLRLEGFDGPNSSSTDAEVGLALASSSETDI
jgi:hypothetical protein